MSDYGDFPNNDNWYNQHHDMSRRNYGKGRHFGNHGDNFDNFKPDNRGKYDRPDGYNRINPLDPPPTLPGGAAKKVPKTEEYQRRTEAPAPRFIEAPSLDLAKGL